MLKIWIFLPRTEVQAYVLVRSKSKFLAAKHLSHNLQRTAKNELKAVFLGRKGLLFFIRYLSSFLTCSSYVTALAQLTPSDSTFFWVLYISVSTR